MKKFILLILLLFAAISHAQTKVIAHKSHSGNTKTFSKAYKSKLFTINNSNFGIVTHKIVLLDTVIALNDKLTLLKIKESKDRYDYGFDYLRLKKSDFKYRTDTLVNHTLFNKKNTASFIKTASPSGYPFWFLNPIEEVVFIGFPKK